MIAVLHGVSEFVHKQAQPPWCSWRVMAGSKYDISAERESGRSQRLSRVACLDVGVKPDAAQIVPQPALCETAYTRL
jgi:hypothetical protein